MTHTSDIRGHKDAKTRRPCDLIAEERAAQTIAAKLLAETAA